MTTPTHPTHDQEALRVRKPQAEVDTPQADVPAPHVPPVVALQGVVGNRAMQRMVIQPKLTVTAANDSYEAEADAVASQVVQSIQSAPVQREGEEDEMMMKRDLVQREGEEDEMMMKREVVQREGEEDELMMKRDIVQREGEEDELMMKRDIMQREGEEDELMAKREVLQRTGDMSGSFEVDSEVEQSIQSERGGGNALPEAVRGSMEGAFGADFSGVRVHTDSTSDKLNRSVGAKAFTQGSDIFFKSGAFEPGSSDGQQLLAHELTHTIQQGAVQQKREE